MGSADAQGGVLGVGTEAGAGRNSARAAGGAGQAEEGAAWGWEWQTEEETGVQAAAGAGGGGLVGAGGRVAKLVCRVYPDAASSGRVGGKGEQQGQQMATGAAEEASTGSGSGDMAAAAAR